MTSAPLQDPAHATAERLRQLDSLRGLAALTVLTAHALSVYPLLSEARLDGALGVLQTLVTRTPLGIFVSGGAAVRLFFVLSGFVLALPFLVGHRGTWSGFAVRRSVRLWPTFVAALALAVTLRLLTPPVDLSGAGEPLQPNWAPALTPWAVLEHVPMVTAFPYYVVDSPMWSLAHEMRISLLFPLLMWLVLRAGDAVALGSTLGLGVLAVTFSGVLGDDFVSAGLTLQFLFLFALGAVLARRRARLGAWYRSLPPVLRLLGWGLAGAAYVAPNLPVPAVVKQAPLDNWVIGLGAAWFIVGVLNEPWCGRLLERRPLTWLGDVSFCVYLVHLPILLAFLGWGQGRVAVPVLILAAGGSALLFAAALHRFVEVPSMSWARSAGRAVDRRVLGRRSSQVARESWRGRRG